MSAGSHRERQLSEPLSLVFCCHPGFYASLVLAELLRSPRLKIVGVVMSTRLMRKNRNLLFDIPRLLRTSGPRYSCYQGIITLGHSLLSGVCAQPTVQALCRRHQLPVWRTLDLNNPDSLSFVGDKSPDYLLTVNFNQKLAAKVLALPARGCINLHPSLLPDYKGVDPVLAAIGAGESRYGVTLHRMDEEFDTGAILAQQKLSIASGECLFWHNVQAFISGATLARGYLEADGEGYVGQDQQRDGSYFGWPGRRQVGRVRRLVRFKHFFELKV